MRNILRVLAAVVSLALLYLALWPVSVRPQAWDAPENPGYTGVYAANDRLAGLELRDIAGRTGPEDAAVGPDGLIYTATHDGDILRLSPEGGAEVFAVTGGRPLGIEFAADGTLWVADAYRGLIAVDTLGNAVVVADATSDGSPILYADDVDIGPDGAVYFSDASTRFGALANGGTLAASVLDLVEHSGSGRVLKHDPASGQTTVFADGLTFANGVAVSQDGQSLYVVETGTYRVWRYPLAGGPGQVVLDNLPGFPDNINPAQDGTFWLGLVSPRNPAMDALSRRPALRRVIMRLPEAMKPAPTRHGFVLRMGSDGRVLETLQDPGGTYALTTGAITLPDGGIVVTSLTEPRLGVLPAPSP